MDRLTSKQSLEYPGIGGTAFNITLDENTYGYSVDWGSILGTPEPQGDGFVYAVNEDELSKIDLTLLTDDDREILYRIILHKILAEEDKNKEANREETQGTLLS